MKDRERERREVKKVIEEEEVHPMYECKQHITLELMWQIEMTSAM